MADFERDLIKAQLSSLKGRVSSRRRSGDGFAQPVLLVPPETKISTTSMEPLPSSGCDHDMPINASDLNRADLGEKPSVGASLTVIKWSCGECSNECIPIMRESRCLCGHRMKEHKLDPRTNTFPCASRSCKCTHFFYLVAEGSWILRCRCKHKHTDHDCGPGSHKCGKCPACTGFDSPWVCNCGHGWSAHVQRTVAVSAEDGSLASGEGRLDKKQHFYRQDGLTP